MDETLRELYPWAKKVVHSFLLDREDLVQEAMIAVWQTAEKDKKPNGSINFLKQSARWRISAVAHSGRSYYGSERSWGTKISTLPVSDISPVWDSLPSSFIGSSVDLAYHYDEIIEAIHSLSQAQQEYVYLRFWRGYGPKQLDEYFGYLSHGLWARAKLKLREKLAHLKGVA